MVRKAYKNWISVGWDIHRSKKEIDVQLRDGYITRLNRLMVIILTFAIKNGLDPKKGLELIKNEKILFKNKEITLHGMIYGGDIPLTFYNEDYKFLNVKGKTVVDIGANIGDTAIYFALNGAKKVISLEPFSGTFTYLVLNIKDNSLADIVIPLNAGYGKGEEIIVNPNLKDTIGLLLQSSKNGVKIKTYSLKSLIEKLDEDALLKMDCEGCEYNLLYEDCETLRKFIQIQHFLISQLTFDIHNNILFTFC